MQNKSNKIKTGLLFGSFNPIHMGHLSIAFFLISENITDEVWFVVSPLNPLKEKKTLLKDEERLTLVNITANNYKGIKACDIEFSLPKPSYTYNTLCKLKNRYPDRDFSLIIGEDNLNIFHRWSNYKEILSEFKLLVYPRTGSNTNHIKKHKNIKIINAPYNDISSTKIREKIKANKNIDNLIPSCIINRVKEIYSNFL